MFDALTGLNTGNSWVRQLTQPDGLNTFNVGNLFSTPLGTNDMPGWWNPAPITFNTPLGINDTPWHWNPNPLNNNALNNIVFPGNLGIGNTPIFNQTRGLLSGIFNGGGGPGMGAIANQGTVLTEGLQALPQPVNGVPNFF